MLTNKKDKLSYIRKACRDNGLTYKKDNYSYINGQDSYKIVDSLTGDIHYSLLSIDDSYLYLVNGGCYEKKY